MVTPFKLDNPLPHINELSPLALILTSDSVPILHKELYQERLVGLCRTTLSPHDLNMKLALDSEAR